MQYAVNYCKGAKMEPFAEIIINYNRQDMELLTFLENHPNQRIILSIKQNDIISFHEAQGWRQLNVIYDKYPFIAVRFEDLGAFHQLTSIEEECIKELTVPYFFGAIVTTFDQLQYFLTQGVCAIYVAEDICFSLTWVKQLCKEKNVQVRAFPNIAQANVRAVPALKKFFIRPEDVNIYEDVIDILEFWGPIERQEVLYRFYSKGRWFGNLRDLILDLDIEFDSRRILPEFAQMRKICNRKCMRGEPCEVCERILSISKKLENHHLIIKPKKVD